MIRDYSSSELKGQVLRVETQLVPDRPDAIAVASTDSSTVLEVQKTGASCTLNMAEVWRQ